MIQIPFSGNGEAMPGVNPVLPNPGPGMRNVVLNFHVEAFAGANGFRWLSDATPITSFVTLVAGQQAFFDFFVYPWVFANPNEALNLEVVGPGNIRGWANFLVQPVVT